MHPPRTKLTCTIGPASVERARELVDIGMSVARINFSHGTPEEQKAAVHAVRAAAHHARRSVAVMVDLPGPKIRLGELPGDELELEVGQRFELRTNRPTLAREVQPGDRILLADGAVELVVVAAAEKRTAAEEPTTEEPATEPATEAPTAVTEPTVEQPTTTEADQPTADAEPTTNAESTTEAPTAADAATQPEADVEGHQVDNPAPVAEAEAEPATSPPPTDEAVVQTEVVIGGLVRSRAGVNVPMERLTGDVLTAEDRAAVPRALELRSDLLAQSFVRSADDVRALRALLPQPGPLIVAKIETRAAVDEFDGILEMADGVMVARGDLGVDLPYERLPLVQKDLLRRALARGRFTIVATQMLESMTAARRPTRAEASDVANAVLDGADGVMLSAETAIGAYPVEAARTMIEICRATENGQPPPPASSGASADPSAERVPADDPQAICRAAVALADAYPPTAAIWCFTRTGRTAELLSVLRPRVPVIAFTINAIAARRAAVRGGVVPIVLPGGGGGKPLVEQMTAAAHAHGLLAEGQSATVVLATTSSRPGGINRLELHTLS